MTYVELHAHSAYSFLDGASLPEELAARAAELGYEALALTDHNGVYGSLEFAYAAKHLGLRAITGAEVTLSGVGSTEPPKSGGVGFAGAGAGFSGVGSTEPPKSGGVGFAGAGAGFSGVGSTEPPKSGGVGFAGAGAGSGETHVTLLVESRRGYENLCRILTEAHADTRPEGKEHRILLEPSVSPAFVAEHADGLVCLSGCARHGLGVLDPNGAVALARAFPGRFYVELQRPYERGDARRNAALHDLAEALGVPVVATGDVHAHHPRRAALQDVLVAIRNRTSLDGCERERRGNHESVLLPPGAMLDRLPRDAVLERTARWPNAARSTSPTSSATATPTSPTGPIRPTCSCAASATLRSPTATRDLNGTQERARERLDEELQLIARIGLSGFFLLHWEVLELARECALEVRGPGSPRHVLPPGRGRGSSVGSIVCYLTGLSHVDPVRNNLSLGRFINDEMSSVPDIDLDFPRDIREKLIVRVTERYGRRHAALVASFATYRSRGAIRDVGKALGLPFAELERLARVTDGWAAQAIPEELERLPDAKRKLLSPRWRAFSALCKEIAGLPRHVSQHPGGMVISTRPLIDLVPVQPAAMAGRQLCQWDKDSCSDAGFLKIDLLGLGMLSAVEECVEQIARLRGEPIDLSLIPLDDKAVYAEIQAADTVGDFQIESRAQMQSLLQTRPENLDDLTVQVALVRPGPIQGKAVHPYIDHRRRLRADPSFVWPVEHESLREPLQDTLGVVVFQDQVLDVAMASAGFSIGEAEGLRRAMSRKRSEEAIEAFRPRFVEGCRANEIDEATAHVIYDKLVGFAGFGFPKSHAAAFGLLAYQSAWLRHHYPAEFLCALLNAQPMGFYPPASLVRDGQRRGVEVRPPHVNLSEAKCSVQDGAVRVGLGYVRSVGEDEARTVAAGQPYRDVADLARRAEIDKAALEALVASGACDEWGARRELLWRLGVAPRSESAGQGNRQLALPLEPTAEVPASAAADRVGADARRLQAHLDLRRDPPADAPPPTPARRRSVERGAAGPAARAARSHRGDGDRPAAPGNREGHRLHADRGRVRPDEPDRPARRLRTAPCRRQGRTADPRPGPLRAGRRQPQRARQRAADARPAGAPGGRERGGRRRVASRPPLRPSLTHGGAAGDALRAERRRPHRLPGHRRRAVRPRVGAGVRLQRRARLDRAVAGGVHPAALVVLPAHPTGQARYGDVRPCDGTPGLRDPHGRRARGHGRDRLRARGGSRRLRRRSDGHPLRGHVPRSCVGARPLEHVRALDEGSALSRSASRSRLPSRRSRRTSSAGPIRPDCSTSPGC